MPHRRPDAQCRAHKCPGHFGDKLLLAIGCRSEGSALVAVQPGAMAGPVRELMKGGAVPVDRFVKSFGRRHRNDVPDRMVKGIRPADPEVGAGCSDERSCFGQDRIAGSRLGSDRDLLGQSFALVGRENRERPEDRNAPGRFFFLISRSAAFAVAGNPACIDNRGTALAAPYRAAELNGLAKGQKSLPGKAAAGGRVPKGQNVDAAIAPPARRIVRQTDGRMAAIPGLDPGHAALCKLRDDLIGHRATDIRPRRSVGCRSVGSGHGRSPRRPAGEPLAALHAVTQHLPPLAPILAQQTAGGSPTVAIAWRRRRLGPFGSGKRVRPDRLSARSP